MTSLYDFSARTIQGEDQALASFRNQVVLVVNVASECGFTPQYAALQQLYDTFRHQGFSVLGFPCNQFGRQEPGTASEIEHFCTEQYAVTFPMFDKIDVNGPDAHPLYRWLKTQKSGILGSAGIKWNFTKFLVGRDGHVLGRYGPTAKPESLLPAIQTALGASDS